MTPPEELIGQRIEIQNLKGKPHLNGSQGETLSWDESKGRMTVKLDSGEQLAIKLHNLKPASSTGSWWWPFGGSGGGGAAAEEPLLDPEKMKNMSQEELLAQVRKLREDRSAEAEAMKETRQNETTFQKWRRYVSGGTWKGFFVRTSVSSALYLMIFLFALSWANSKIIACEKCTATAPGILGKPPFLATMDDLRKVRYLNSTAQLFKGLSAFAHIEPYGKFEAPQNPHAFFQTTLNQYVEKALNDGMHG